MCPIPIQQLRAEEGGGLIKHCGPIIRILLYFTILQSDWLARLHNVTTYNTCEATYNTSDSKHG